jgi:hypothetical protein
MEGFRELHNNTVPKKHDSQNILTSRFQSLKNLRKIIIIIIDLAVIQLLRKK